MGLMGRSCRIASTFRPAHTTKRGRCRLRWTSPGVSSLKDVSGRVVVLTASGESLYASIAQFGNQPTLAQFGDDERARVFDHVGRFSWWIDAKAGRWQPDAYWGLPPNVSGGDTVMGYFADGGKKFGLFRASWREPGEKNPRGALLVVRFDNYLGRPVLLYTSGKTGWVVRRDTNKDGLIDGKDGPGARCWIRPASR